MKKKNILAVVIMTLAAALLLSACGLSGGDENPSVVFSKNPAGVVGFTVSDTPLTQEEAVSNGYSLSADDKHEVSYSSRKASATYDELCGYGMDNDIFYPGALVDIETMTPISIAQAPLSISLGGAEGWIGNSSAPISTIVQAPRTDTMREGIRLIINGILGSGDITTHGQLSFSIHEIESEQDFQLGIGMGYKGYGVDMKDKFSFSNMNKSTNLVMVLKQVYYTVDVSRPAAEYDFFANTVTNEQLKTAIPASKIPTYVASVSYGRMVMISIQSNFSKKQIENELTASFGNKLIGEITADSNLKTIVQSHDTDISCFVYGGSQEDSNKIATAAAAKDFDKIISAMLGNYDPKSNIGLPLSYKFRHLDGSLALMRSSDEYDIKTVKYLPEKVINWSYLDSLI
ncbi:MAG: thiol-activated cytolysin family protein, partial [Clostridiales bacterium]|nr:thiol-activated cytolysin family protein [Clostridiales bacterium]